MRVRFVGPEFKKYLVDGVLIPLAGAPEIGQLGTIIEDEGGRIIQRFGEPSERLVTVLFDGTNKATVISMQRLVEVP